MSEQQGSPPLCHVIRGLLEDSMAGSHPRCYQCRTPLVLEGEAEAGLCAHCDNERDFEADFQRWADDEADFERWADDGGPA